VNKKVDGQRKWKSKKEHKRESRYLKSTNGKVKEQKEKKKEKSYRGNNNRGEIEDLRKATRKGRRRRMHGKKSSYRQ
jgi:hypothetical protein